jgi:hypothetical protein
MDAFRRAEAIAKGEIPAEDAVNAAANGAEDDPAANASRPMAPPVVNTFDPEADDLPPPPTVATIAPVP